MYRDCIIRDGRTASARTVWWKPERPSSSDLPLIPKCGNTNKIRGIYSSSLLRVNRLLLELLLLPSGVARASRSLNRRVVIWNPPPGVCSFSYSSRADSVSADECRGVPGGEMPHSSSCPKSGEGVRVWRRASWVIVCVCVLMQPVWLSAGWQRVYFLHDCALFEPRRALDHSDWFPSPPHPPYSTPTTSLPLP